MKRWLKRSIIIAVIAVVMVTAYFIYDGMTAKAQIDETFSTKSNTGVTTKGDITLTVSGSGNLKSAEHLNIETASYVVIDEVHIEEGDTVAEGDIIATLDTQTMGEHLTELEQQINSIQTDIDTLNSVKTNLNIKSPVDGWTKNIVLDDDEYIEDAMQEYGYVAVVATEERELINAADSGLIVGDTVKVKCEGYWHGGEVVSEDGQLYVSIDTVYRTVGAEVVVYDNEDNELFTGAIELASYEMIESSFGIITDVRVSEDEEIEAGDVIYRASQYSLAASQLYDDLRDAKEEYELVEQEMIEGDLKAPQTGVVTNIEAIPSKEFNEGEVLYTIASTDLWEAVVAVDELDINSIEIGQNVEVTLDSMPNETFSGQVTSISDKGSASGGITTYDVDVLVEDNDGFKIAMTLNCEIETQSAEGAILAPIDAIRTSMSKNYVMVAVDRTDEEIETIKQLIVDNNYTSLANYLGDDAQTLDIKMLTDWSELLYGEVRAVETGLQNAFYSEIKSGLSEGETVLLKASDSSSAMTLKFMQGMQGMGGGQMPSGFQRPNKGGN